MRNNLADDDNNTERRKERHLSVLARVGSDPLLERYLNRHFNSIVETREVFKCISFTIKRFETL